MLDLKESYGILETNTGSTNIFLGECQFASFCMFRTSAFALEKETEN
jgi:hypothetical protein